MTHLRALGGPAQGLARSGRRASPHRLADRVINDREPMHCSCVRVVVPDRIVLRLPVVPHRHITELPLPPALIVRA